MILTSGARGRRFDSANSPFLFCWRQCLSLLFAEITVLHQCFFPQFSGVSVRLVIFFITCSSSVVLELNELIR